jgi:hypothetical protein
MVLADKRSNLRLLIRLAEAKRKRGRGKVKISVWKQYKQAINQKGHGNIDIDDFPIILADDKADWKHPNHRKNNAFLMAKQLVPNRNLSCGLAHLALLLKDELAVYGNSWPQLVRSLELREQARDDDEEDDDEEDALVPAGVFAQSDDELSSDGEAEEEEEEEPADARLDFLNGQVAKHQRNIRRTTDEISAAVNKKCAQHVALNKAIAKRDARQRFLNQRPRNA